MEPHGKPSPPPRPVPAADARWLIGIQRRTFLPLKLAIALLCLALWQWSRGWLAPSPAAFGVFFVYAAFLAAEAYFLIADRVPAEQARAAAWCSYLLDIAFITALTLLDWAEPALGRPDSVGFNMLYVPMLLRGVALFRSRPGTLAATGVLGLLFLATSLVELRGADLIEVQEAGLRFALVGFVLFLSLVVVDLVRRQQDEIAGARERLARSEGLAQVGELAAGVAHEINNPIGIISTYAEYLLRLPECPNREDIEQIRAEAKRCEAIVARLLDFARPSVAKLERIAPAELLAELREFLLLDKASQIPVELRAEEGLPPLLGDKALLRQALLNCALNARQAQAEAGTASPMVQLAAERDAGGVRLAIRDRGPGVPRHEADRLFDPFYTTREKGTGLGLAIARRIAESHGGALALRNRGDGPGAEAILTLPAAPP
ncbi:MAG: ATP-binding protein [Candidatus Sumerlaeia bacterium]|nr:ATP-binding protein [Candidatus Sumerlaeia bacterium]